MLGTLTYQVLRLPDLDIVAASLPFAYEDECSVELNDVGSGSLKLPADDPALDDIQIHDIIRVKINNSTYIGAWIVEQMEDHTIDAAGDAATYTRLSGRGVGALLEWAVIVPANGVGSIPIEEERLFSWQAPKYPDGWWDNAIYVDSADKRAGWPSFLFNRGDAIFGPSSTSTTSPNGATFLRKTFDIDEDIDVHGWGVGDNWGRVWIDGIPLVRLGEPGTNAYKKTFEFDLRLSEGEHTIAARIYNKGSDNLGGLRILMVDADNWKNVIFETDNTWVALESITESNPGYNPGMAVGEALGEAHDRGALTFINKSFTNSVDTDGTAWPKVGEIGTKTGNDYLTFLEELTTTYVDWRVNPATLELDMWVKDQQGSTPGVTLSTNADPEQGQIITLDRKRT